MNDEIPIKKKKSRKERRKQAHQKEKEEKAKSMFPNVEPDVIAMIFQTK